MVEVRLAAMAANYLPYEPQQMLLLPEALQDWLPEGHLAHFIGDTVDTLDLGAFHARYDKDGPRNQPFHPAMMVKVLVDAYASGVFSSRNRQSPARGRPAAGPQRRRRPPAPWPGCPDARMTSLRVDATSRQAARKVGPVPGRDCHDVVKPELHVDGSSSQSIGHRRSMSGTTFTSWHLSCWRAPRC